MDPVRRVGGHDLQDGGRIRTEGGADQANMPVLPRPDGAGAQEAFRPGAAGSGETVPDDTEVVAPEQHNWTDTPVHGQTSHDQRDQADVFLSGIIQAGRQFRGEMGAGRKLGAAAFHARDRREPASDVTTGLTRSVTSQKPVSREFAFHHCQK